MFARSLTGSLGKYTVSLIALVLAICLTYLTFDEVFEQQFRDFKDFRSIFFEIPSQVPSNY